MKIVDKGNYYTITHFPLDQFKHDIIKLYKTSKISHLVSQVSSFMTWFRKDVSIHKFFIPELVYILNSTNSNRYHELLYHIKTETWYKRVVDYIDNGKTIPTRTDFSLIKKEMNVELKPYQKEFIQTYNRKIIYNLRGYLLAFEQGLGKTLTALALMTSLNKKQVIIICPKSTMISVWKYHIEKFYKTEKKIWIPGLPLNNKYDYYLVNYESMSKLNTRAIDKDCGVVVDESHNFLHGGANRTQNLVNLSKVLDSKCESFDILLMSGTPLKAIGVELIPVLNVLDRRFDDDCSDIFKRSLSLTKTNGTQILANRLGILMYRKLKNEVLTLPKKNELIRKVKLPDGIKYTHDRVVNEIVKFTEERRKFYFENKKKYIDDFEECVSYLDKKLHNDQKWKLYLDYVNKLKKTNERDSRYYEIIKWTVSYEKNVLYKLLPPDLKKKFIQSKSVVKYVWMKIMGEVIGNLLLKLRNEMCKGIIEHAGIDKIIKESKKKTLLFTSYTECVEYARDYLKKKGFSPVCVYGETTNKLKDILRRFREDDDVNPLIATIQTLSTGVTLTEANTIIFLNKPWRYNEYQQASDRIHRIGQDTEVFIYTLLLDTDGRENLSTGMERVMEWSKEMFEHMMGEN